MKRESNNPVRKTTRTKLLLTATMCAVLLLGASACNNGNNVNTNSNGINDDANNMPTVTDETVVPTATDAPAAE
ncbi:hypothetical protein B1748_26870 [Paenibacillus sp. MY03]|uniref:Uncharacterized protein n=1 Tax=Paenibacillus agaridevorans TaxID=171404 RepID=A0A2R5EIY4_9BACL|nr:MULTISPECIES: hypothetical protein [Paenibacillus]OUS71351.1 hypothetical protein B1748_26870 [Paenibacillus sp. MY03]QNK54373.1 hypothetical protein H7F31_16960 [Paenibacillus sp. PAMC21692]GBG06035.1 hypothetical protein PAT3040_00528 [Paenibacillus agaridevorans]